MILSDLFSRVQDTTSRCVLSFIWEHWWLPGIT